MTLYRVFLIRRQVLHESLTLVVESDLPAEQIAEKAFAENQKIPEYKRRQWFADAAIAGRHTTVKIEVIPSEEPTS